ncbi:DNA mismatch repair protein MLH3 isoform X2 [Diospyros lotus]|uniref:DNA mismatch repair protein MLH3 isoform X2 n=1 Tax=Diospyros lotus TaxID=55363 RepID=UPI00224CAEFF|nr:DNA mismatch repair protein MLH3 isoform X2 [Diospyros lotus]
MGDIKHLPDAVHSSVRSGIILFNLTRVVEELIFNSLDAGATKIYVAIGVGTCYVKVVDNGCGIDREGLMLLGERYATSKSDQLADTDSVARSFGFRGEALSSISDVSLLEVITKAHGKPNGYRKVIKECKCLYLGIDDGRQDVGTTVIVRDLFYNQPVRRKHIQSSTKKVLQSVKKSVLRIALVHPKVFLKLVDIESEDELFCTAPSSSPLSLVMSNLGIEVCGSLCELNVSDGVLKLSGYMSSPCDTSFLKAFQYVYINSRYIFKCPIHKLLNQLAAGSNFLDMQKAKVGSQNSKRSRSQTDVTFILDLSCPRSWYDLTFEPSKTSVEFRDWFPILGFIEKAITDFWSENFSYGHGHPLAHGTGRSVEDKVKGEADNRLLSEEALPVKYGIRKGRGRIHNPPASFVLPCPWVEMQTDDSKCCQNNKRFSSCNDSEKECHTGLGFLYQTDYSLQSCDGYHPLSRITAEEESGSYMQDSNINIFSDEDCSFRNKCFAAEKNNDTAAYTLGSSLQDECLNMDVSISNTYSQNELSCDYFEIGTEMDKVSGDPKMPFLQSCSFRRSLPYGEESLLSSEGFDFQNDGLRTKRKRLETDDWVNVAKVHDLGQRFDFLQTSMVKDGAASLWPSPRSRTKNDVLSGVDFLSNDLLKLSENFGECLARENDPLSDLSAQIRQFGSTHHSSDFKWSPVMSGPAFEAKSHAVEQFAKQSALDGCMAYSINARYDCLADSEVKDYDFHIDNSVRNSSSLESFSFSGWNTVHSDSRSHACSGKNSSGFFGRHTLDDVLSPKCLDICYDEAKWLCLNSYGKSGGNCFTVRPHHISKSVSSDKDKNKKDRFIHQEAEYAFKKKTRRSHSCPPFYRGKKKFLTSNNRLTVESRKAKVCTIEDASTFEETSELKHLQRSSGMCQLHSEPTTLEAQLVCTSLACRPDKKKVADDSDVKKFKVPKNSEGLYICSRDSVEEFSNPLDSQPKWGKSCQNTVNGNKLHNLHEGAILDISSGILHLAGDSLVPESMNRNCIEDAKVLQQVDKKFIAVVGSGVLALIDQHAADERIRLEELRQKVLSGEKKTITYLDTEKKLVLPETGYQLLHNYAEQVHKWGWLCNFHGRGSRSFRKNLNLLHKEPTVVTVLAVPCILGVNLTDGDLLEFLQQLADTDGSSTIPPSVLRILNSKACRGAIMFGDALLPSECSLIVEELRRTSLCFQCAHGRPTTVPLVNLEALHKQIQKLGSSDGVWDMSWRGLCRQELSLERATCRLKSARDTDSKFV